MQQDNSDHRYSILNNRYQIIKELGHGSFGTTYLAKDKQADDSWCAVKKLNSDKADNKIVRKLFKREADILLQLQQVPQVPKFIDYFEEDNDNYIVEEYIEGSLLKDIIHHHWNERNIIIFLWEILSILQLLHNENIVHRDIKPSNLIQREDNKFTIIDFGAVKKIDPICDRLSPTRIYAEGYSPPEQIDGFPQLNSDIYALGMTTIQLLTKKHPRKVVRCPSDRIILPESEFVPLWLIDILNKMVRTKFEERYQSVEEVLKDLGQRNNPKPEAPEVDDAKTTKLATTNYLKKLWYLPLIVLPLLIIVSELTNPWLRPKYYIYQGNNLLDNRQAEASVGKFQEAIDLQREWAAAWLGRGNALFTLGRYSGALEAYNKAIAIEPNNIKALNNKGTILARLGQPQKAIDTYNQAIEIEPENAEAWSDKGLAYLNMQQFEQALKSFEQAKTIKPDEPNFWLQKGIALGALQRPQKANEFYQEAINVYDEVTAKEENNPLLWTDRGFVLLQLNRPQEAFASYDRALMLDNSFYEALMGKANAYLLVKDYQSALATFDQAKKVRPQDYQVWYNRGEVLLQFLENPQDALASFEQAIQLNPNFYPAWLRKGIALNDLQKHSDALLTFDTAKDLNPQDPFLWMNRGIALEALGELEAAAESYQTAIDLEFIPAKGHLERLRQKT